MASTQLKTVLSLDGGGIRGIITAQILTVLEEKLNEAYKELHDLDTLPRPLRLAQFFDFVAGTSTGGILACALLAPEEKESEYPRYSAEEALDLYLQHGQAIFSKDFSRRVPLSTTFFKSKYGNYNIERILQEKFGDDRLSDLVRPCLITSYDIEKRAALFFTQHDARKKGEMYDFYVRDVARSTSAAPTYFAPATATSVSELTHHTIDGGLFANNPTMCAFIEGLKIFGAGYQASEAEAPEAEKSSAEKARTLFEPSKMFILSLGTGLVEKKYQYDKAINWGLINWVAPIIDIMMTAVAETVDYQLRRLFDSIGKPDQYFRIMPNLYSAEPDMDDTSDENLRALQQAGLANAKDYDDELTKIARKLVEIKGDVL